MTESTHQQFWEDLKSGKFTSMVKESSKGRTVSNSAEVFNILKPIVASHTDVEALYGIFLDAKNHIIAIEKLFSGSITGSPVYPREIVKRIIGLHAAAIAIAHNHPSGNPEPSREDIEITERIGIVLYVMSVSFHDHVIIGNTYFSMADNGYLKSAQKKFNQIFTDF